MSSSNEREFDLVIFGATGFTGHFIIRELVLSIEENPTEYGQLRWAVAGRSEVKLKESLQKVADELNKPELTTTVPIMVANVEELESIRSMARRARLVINSVGPYRLYGVPVVEACTEAGTHHLDLSGEPGYIHQCVLDYDHKARQTGALILSTCGWDSIPLDLGVHYLKRNFPGRLASVESFVSILPGEHGYSINFGTFHSALYITADFFRERAIYRTLQRRMAEEKKQLESKDSMGSGSSAPNLSMRLLPFTRPDVPGVSVPFLGVDKHVAERSEHYGSVHYGEAPVQVQTYYTFERTANLLKVLGLGALFGPLTLLEPGRALLRRWPHVFTLGYFSKQGPTRAQIDTTRFTTRLIGKGWSDVSNKTEDSAPNTRMDRQMTVLVSGRDPAYLATSTLIVQTALSILSEGDKVPKGGVLTPVAALRETRIVDRLQARGVNFEVVSNQRIA